MLGFSRRSLPRSLQPFLSTSHARVNYTTYKRTFTSEQSKYEDFGLYDVILPDEPFIFGVSHIRRRNVPQHIVKPAYALSPDGALPPEDAAPKPRKIAGKIKLGGEEESRLRQAAKLAAKVRDFAGSLVKPGVTTLAIDEAVHDFIVSHSAYPSPLNYQGFPRSCCTSINNVIVHGIPDERPLQDSDIINIDITIFLNGYHGDTSKTFLVGDVDEPGRELVRITDLALEQGIRACGPGRPFKGIGTAIDDFIRSQDKEYSVSSQFTGHGIGKLFHSAPWILHHRNDEPGVMEPGHCFTIEPAIIQGSDSSGWIFPDGWTASTENCARSAQAEHMVLITEEGADILTR